MSHKRYTTKEAAERLNVKPQTLEQWRWRGCGPRFIKIGRAVRYDEAELDCFVAAHTFSSTTAASSVVVRP